MDPNNNQLEDTDTESYSYGSEESIIIVDESDDGQEPEEAPEEQPGDPELARLWGPIRLFLEASMEDSRQGLDWCIARGILKDLCHCRIHRRDTEVRQRADRKGLYFWYCGKCDHRRSVLVGARAAHTPIRSHPTHSHASPTSGHFTRATPRQHIFQSLIKPNYQVSAF